MTNDDRNPNLMKNRYVFGLTGASLAGLTGASIVGPVGAIVGAVLGFLVGFNMLKRF
jgi:outer membrane lipoprotein SlyB